MPGGTKTDLEEGKLDIIEEETQIFRVLPQWQKMPRELGGRVK